MDPAVELADLLVTTAVAAVGLWLAHTFRRQQRLKVAERRLEAYRDLWALMKTARASRGDGSDPHGAGALTRKEALTLFDAMTDWYYDEGRGMLLTDETKELYLEAKERLGRYATGGGDALDEREGIRRIRELSLLRTQMKYDVGIYGVFYFHELKEPDRDFLAARGFDPEHWAARFVPLHRRVLRRVGRWRRSRRGSEVPRTQTRAA